nr:hypothetical protein [uncultured Methanobacterium sp.]
MKKQIILTMLTLFIAVILASSASAVMTVSNGIYNVSVQDNLTEDDVGTWTACTGPNHPYPDQDVLYGGVDQDPYTTYLTVRDITGQTDYTSRSGRNPSAPYTQEDLDDYAVSVTQVSPTQIDTTWVVGTSSPLFQVLQSIQILGTTYEDSRIQVTTYITNLNQDIARNFAIRYYWDLAVAGNDGSQVRPRDPDGAWQTTEEGWIDPTFKEWEATDDPNNPTFSVYGSVINPTGSTPPELLIAAAYEPSRFNAYDYTPTGQSITSDSAMLYYWDPITVQPRGTSSVTAFLFTAPFNAPTNSTSTATTVGAASATTTSTGKTIPMQTTGAPIGLLIVGMLVTVAGTVYPRMKK